ncbi:hypothetical protein GCM10009718_18280 [Isoptericola halotolerans]|uniref:DUF916 domain-containing protein n=1 Tax=Isoptericola halotolerans TaxID=300560 RepID=A0ABX2A984_9MICO|nr:hypothetical protein [Isoptericola halotolerans]NOV98585.1 hypothetical protein [Isoptericola halotolerans]
MLPRALVAVALGGVAALVPAPAAVAATPSPEADQITWSVVPADASGPDGRSVIDVELDGGQSTLEHVAVTNHGEKAVTFAMSANDGYLTANGSFDMRPSGTPATDGGSWIAVPDEVTVDGGDTAVVPVEIEVPTGATPGDHPAGVAASVVSSENQVDVEHRVGVRVDLRVPGEVVAALDVSQVRATFEPSWNPFEPGTLDVTLDVTNTGTVRLDATAEVEVEAAAVDARAETPVGEMLAGGGRQVSTSLDRVWPVGPVSTTVTVVPRPAEGDELAVAPDPVTTTVTTWALPIPQLLLALLVLTVVFLERDRRRRRRADLAAQLARARAEGAAAARGASN